MAANIMDLDKPGFFHYDTNLLQGKLPHDQVTYWYKKQKQLLQLCFTNGPEVGAIENTIGVFTFVLQGKDEAIKYFETLLEKPQRSKVNTLANMIFILKDDSVRAAQLTKKLEGIQKDDSLKCKLEVSRAMCERGHFCEHYVLEEVHNTESTKVAADLLRQGIEKGKEQGMGSNEVCIWQFYLFKAAKDILIDQAIRGNPIEDFEATMSTFLEFDALADETLHQYKSMALVEIAALFSSQRVEIEEQPEYLKFCQEKETLNEIWQDATSACEEALAMSPNDYRIPFKAARVYSRQHKFEEAQACIDNALELNSDINIGVMNCQMKLYQSRGFEASTVDKDRRIALEWFLKAYKYGKEIENVNKYATTATLVEMNSICFDIAVDRTAQPWQMKPEKEVYLDEAIEYGERAASSFTYGHKARAFSGLGQSYAFKNNFTEAAKYMGLALDAERPGRTENLFKHWKYLSEKYHQDRQQETVREIAGAFENAWLKHPRDAVVGVFVKYGNNYVAKKNRLIEKVLKDLSMARSEAAPKVLWEFCTVVVGNPTTASWVKDICEKYL